jgi:hypothetical protein
MHAEVLDDSISCVDTWYFHFRRRSKSEDGLRVYWVWGNDETKGARGDFDDDCDEPSDDELFQRELIHRFHP